MVGDDLRIDGCLKDGSRVFQVMPERRRVNQVAIVGERKCSFYIIQYKGLRVLARGCARRGIAHMSHANIAFQRFKIVWRKHFIDQPHSLVGCHFSLWPACLTHGNATALLSPVLQCKKPVINRGCDIVSVKIINAKDAALLIQPCLVYISVYIIIVHNFSKYSSL